MFTAGRILGQRAGSRAAERTSIFGDQWAGTSSTAARERRKFRLYVPCVWQSVLATAAGFVAMAAGVSLCVVGFLSAGRQPPSGVRQGSNHTEVHAYDDAPRLRLLSISHYTGHFAQRSTSRKQTEYPPIHPPD